MSRKSIITIAVGVLLLVILLLVSNQVTSVRVAALRAETDPQKKVEGYQRVDTIRTAFLAGGITVLLITGVLAFHWWKSGITPPPPSNETVESVKYPIRMPVYFAIIPGILAVITSFTSILLDVLVFDKYGGVGSNFLICVGLPAAIFGMLAGLAWYGIRRKAGISRKDAIPLFVIGILAGLLPNALIKMLPQ